MGTNCSHPTCDGECRREVKKKKIYYLNRSPKIATKPKKKLCDKEINSGDLNRWFLERAKECTGICSCCGKPSSIRSGVFWKWSIAHIFPKEKIHGFPSIATHPDNWIELCIQCHTLFDRSLHVAHTLPCWGIVVKKFLIFEEDIKETSRKYLSLFKEYAS
jgi:hypothetical protein